MKLSNIELVFYWLLDEQIDADICSPNFVADFAFNRSIDLESWEIVFISNNYQGA